MDDNTEDDPKFQIKGETDADDDGDQGSAWSRLLKEVAVVVAIVLVLMFVLTQFFFRQYVVPSESMESTLHGCYGCSNDRIVVDKTAYWFSDPKPGDVVVFKGPSESWDGAWVSPRSENAVVHRIQDVLSWFALSPPNENNLVKRVIAVGGQTVACDNSNGLGVTVDGKPLDEPYIDKDLQVVTATETDGVLGAGSCYGDDFGPIEVPEGNVWVMGDNRSNSADSRFHVEDEFSGTVPVDDIRGKVRFIIYPFSRIGGVGDHDPQS